MSERVAGKTFSTPEEAGVEAPTPEELAKYRKMFEEAKKKRDAIDPNDRVMLGPKFWDDTSGTEFDRNR
ncbi:MULTISPECIES: hypothetical protein [unclassified Nocardia]|jgi:hypothetical protein|uniref:hypothetical protein n=1 Tax=unclassified Nocardia TaxID=2637762 RepID=UPI001C4E98C2|nr:hypothetical protein [Nocardia sp. MH4]